MLRYYAVATCIVLAIAVLATAWSNRDRIRERVARSAPPHHFAASTTPHSGFESEDRAGNAPMRGDAPWALSALPECLIQQSISTGSLGYVRSKMPADATTVLSGTILHYGPCTIFVRDGEALVSRGPDRLRIPPHVTLYRAGNRLALLRENGATGELRIYTTSRL